MRAAESEDRDTPAPTVDPVDIATACARIQQRMALLLHGFVFRVRKGALPPGLLTAVRAADQKGQGGRGFDPTLRTVYMMMITVGRT